MALSDPVVGKAGDTPPLIGKIAGLQNLKEYAELNWSGAFEDYLNLVRKTPAITRSAFQRVYDMILGYGQEEDIDNKKRLIRYNFFNALHAIGDNDVPFDFGTCGGYCPRTDSFFHPRYDDFDPRIGIAWAHGNTVVVAFCDVDV